MSSIQTKWPDGLPAGPKFCDARTKDGFNVRLENPGQVVIEIPTFVLGWTSKNIVISLNRAKIAVD